jgi:hypothetical protein
MAMHPTVTLTARSGTSYPFTVFPLGTPLAAVGGVYAILRDDEGGRWTVLYIGQTGDLSSRFDNHHQEMAFRRHRATHIAAIGISGEERRRQVEADLVGTYAPPINQTAHG